MIVQCRASNPGGGSSFSERNADRSTSYLVDRKDELQRMAIPNHIASLGSPTMPCILTNARTLGRKRHVFLWQFPCIHSQRDRQAPHCTSTTRMPVAMNSKVSALVTPRPASAECKTLAHPNWMTGGTWIRRLRAKTSCHGERCSRQRILTRCDKTSATPTITEAREYRFLHSANDPSTCPRPPRGQNSGLRSAKNRPWTQG